MLNPDPVSGGSGEGVDPLIRRILRDSNVHEWRYLAGKLGKQLTSAQVNELQEAGYMTVKFPRNDAPQVELTNLLVDNLIMAVNLNPEQGETVAIYPVTEIDRGVGINLIFDGIEEKKAEEFSNNFGVTIHGLTPDEYRGRQ